MIMGRYRFFCTVAVLLTCAMLILTSCSRLEVFRTPVKKKGLGPPAHAPAHGYRRKQQQALVGVSGGALAGASVGAIARGDKKSALIGAAAGAGAGYIIINEQDKKRTKAEMDSLRQEINIVTVNVTNSNGSVSPVKLRKQGVGYVGPQNEYYDHLPTGEELQSIYGF